jgi:DNA integrity scanning protein DisA with diadenylate cyclase activity
MKAELLYQLLDEVRHSAGPSFSGVGILVSDNLNALPIVPLRPLASVPTLDSTREILIAISDQTHELHDGFHILAPDLRVVRLSQYFSPSIVPGLHMDSQRRVGGRYMAALFGSTLQDVLVSGVASADYGVAVFEDGIEVIGHRHE